MVEWWAWAAVLLFIIGMLLVDLLVFHRDEHETSHPRKRPGWSIAWVTISLAVRRGDLVDDGRRPRPASTSAAT